MQIELLGQACILVSVGNVRVLCDPWFSGRAHLGGWEAFPAPTEVALEHARERADLATHIYISHAHDDHFDPTFLRSLAPKELLVGRFHNARFNAALHALGRHHSLRPLASGQAYKLGSRVSATIHAEQPDYRTNSVLELNTPFGAVINANDCGLDSALLRSFADKSQPLAFFYTLNFLANGYPFPYLRAGDAELGARIDVVRDQIVDSFRSALRALRPRVAFAFAGPVSFVDAINDHLNAHAQARDWRAMVEELATEGALLWPAPGSIVDIDEAEIRTDRVLAWGPCRQSLVSSAHGDQWLEADLVDPRHFASDLGAFAQARRSLASRIGLEAVPALVLSTISTLASIETQAPLFHDVIRFGATETSVQRLEPSAELPAPRLQISTSSRILHAFLRGEIDLDMLLLSGRTRFAREPDAFHLGLHNLLRFGHDPESAEALVRWATGAHTQADAGTLEVNIDGVAKQIPRHCPHEAEDWLQVPIIDGVITCPRHKWKFDLRTGKCLSGDPSVNLFQARKKGEAT